MIGWKNYVKKPVMIRAMQFTGTESAAEIIRFTTGVREEKVVDDQGRLVPCLIIHTLEGEMQANLNDWVIIGTQGEVYACKPRIFEEVYEPMSAGAEIPQ